MKVSIREIANFKGRGHVRWEIYYRDLAGPKTEIFQTEAEALGRRAELSRMMPDLRRLLNNMSADERAIAAMAIKAARESGVNLVRAVDSATNGAVEPITVRDAVDRHVEAKKASGVSSYHINNTLWGTSTLVAVHGSRPLHELTEDDLLSLVNAYPSMDSRRTMLGAFSGLWIWAADRSHVPTNRRGKTVAQLIKKPKRRPGRVDIYTVDQSIEIMQAVESICPKLIPHYALRLYAGLRPVEEAANIQWSDIRKGRVAVPESKVAGSVRRFVPMNEPLAYWLSRGGMLPLKGINRRWWHKKLRSSVGFEMPKNAMRHSFISYFVALNGIGATENVSGNSRKMIKDHYLEVVEEEEAVRFFSETQKKNKKHIAKT